MAPPERFQGRVEDLKGDESRDVWPFCEICDSRGVVVCKTCHAAVFCGAAHAQHYKHNAQCSRLAASPEETRCLYTMKWPQVLLAQTK